MGANHDRYCNGWFDMMSIKTKSDDVIANMLEQNWLSNYRYTTEIILDQGTEFTKEVIESIEKDYGITCQPITTQNPQVNSILEHANQTISNILRTFQVNKSELDLDDPWSRILSAVIFAM